MRSRCSLPVGDMDHKVTISTTWWEMMITQGERWMWEYKGGVDNPDWKGEVLKNTEKKNRGSIKGTAEKGLGILRYIHGLVRSWLCLKHRFQLGSKY